jgi:predicted phage tail protein
MDHHWLTLLSKMRPTEELLEQLPTIAARQWETRKGRIAKDAEALSKRLADQTTLNQKLITAKLNGEISQEDFDTMKASISAEKQKIIEQVNTLDTERSAMQDLMKQAKQQTFNFVAAWQQANVNQKQELAKGLFPDGLMFSMENKFFEPANEAITALYVRTLQDFAAGKDLPIDIGVPDGI